MPLYSSVYIIVFVNMQFIQVHTEVYVPRWGRGHVPSSPLQPYFRVQVEEEEQRACTVIRFQWGHRRIRQGGTPGREAGGHLAARANSCHSSTCQLSFCVIVSEIEEVAALCLER